MAECFTDDAHFVAYAGSRLTGGKATGDWRILSLQVTRGREIHLAGDHAAAAEAWRALRAHLGQPRQTRDITPWQEQPASTGDVHDERRRAG
jgi:hypothetical protein